ncbi:MAG: diacylglycerol kinase catalytic region [Candidatus Saccharibacteria bacterium]|nr:diacylglycerol kinase catalytic region [Candidatus Saccharibacteria bacterium]
MANFSDIAVIYNPNSTGSAKENAVELRDELKSALPNTSLTMLPTKRAGHAIELAYDFAKNHKNPLIISASGDGGYNEVINGALKAQDEGATPICAVLPSGNANDHARTMQDKPLVELIKNDAVTQLDVLKVLAANEDGTEVHRYAHSYAGIGLTPTVAVELNKHTLNSLKEAYIVIKTFWSYRPVTILSDGKKLALDSLICSTIPEMAKVLTISQNSKPRDGLFEVATFRHHRKISFLFRLIRGVFKHLGAQKRTDKYAFTVLMPAPMQVDGEVMELMANTNVTITICPRLLHTIAAV